MGKLSYKTMFKRAAEYINSHGGYYKGYSGGNALSLFVNDRYGVNAVECQQAHNALCDAMPLLHRAENDCEDCEDCEGISQELENDKIRNF